MQRNLSWYEFVIAVLLGAIVGVTVWGTANADPLVTISVTVNGSPSPDPRAEIPVEAIDTDGDGAVDQVEQDPTELLVQRRLNERRLVRVQSIE
jgi:hypothetical protein